MRLLLVWLAMAGFVIAAAPAPSPTAAKRTISGQVFVQIEADNVRISQARVTAYPLKDMAQVVKQVKAVPSQAIATTQDIRDREAMLAAGFERALKGKPVLGSSVTDADGNFTLAVPEGAEVMLYVSGLLRVRKVQLVKHWLVPATEGRMILTAENSWR